jgi:hypothetical protein
MMHTSHRQELLRQR